MAETRIEVRLRPRGHADELLGFDGGVLRARVSAPPVDGKANKALCHLVAKQAGVAPSGLDESELIARLGSDG